MEEKYAEMGVCPQQVLPTPGPCPTTGCPPTREVVCVEVVKVYDSCFQCECIEGLTVVPAVGQPAPLTVLSTTARVLTFDCVFGDPIIIPGLPGRRRVTFNWTVEVTVRYTAVDGSTQTIVTTFSFTKDVPLYVAPGFEALMFCRFFAQFDFLRVRIVGTSIVFDFGMSLLFKTAADVQLLIPAYGFCVPPRCREIPTACEDFVLACELNPPNFNPPQPTVV